MVKLLEQYKVNTIRWHLTEDQGWRQKINKYPETISIGASHPESPVPGNCSKGDGKPFTLFTLKRK